MDKIFKTRPSKWIMGMYWVVLVFLVAMTLVMCPVMSIEPLAYQFFVTILSLIILLFILMIFRAYRMKFVVTKNSVVIHGVFSTWTVSKKEIKSVKKTLIPLGIRLYGASFLGGWYYIPTVGKVRVAMANFEDGVMIETKDGKHYLITPEKPHEFIKAVK